MGIVFLDLAVSLDGFISARDGGDGGLHDWYFAEPGAATDIVDDLQRSIGAIVMGRRAFGAAPDGFDTPYTVPHFVMTHAPRPPVERGGASFAFVSGDPADVLALARPAAADRDVCVAGGADVARQFLRSGLLDEVRLHVAPVLLGGGLRLFDDSGPPVRLERTHVSVSAHATHLRYRPARP